MSAVVVYAPGRVWKKRRLRRPSQRNANAAATDNRSQWRTGWIRTGVSPRGAQVRRTTGCVESPLSSSKRSQARWRRAFFLPRASAAAPTAEWWPRRARALAVPGAAGRSEEHTSELQSRENLVCRLLLEKKKKKKKRLLVSEKKTKKRMDKKTKKKV